jgi:triacylglycerol esterase/lipase EstA (alpha/beta hydrolase family)
VLHHLSPARRRLLVALGTAAVTLLAIIGVVVVVTQRDDGVVPVAQNRLGPVLILPGYGGSTASVEPLVTLLTAEGRDVTVVVPEGDGKGDLRSHAERLEQAADDALARTGASSVDVIGYSAGGVVARLWVRELDGASEARRVVTLGSPHHGTDLAGEVGGLVPEGCPTGCQQLAPDSELLRRLNAGDETPRGPAFVSVWTSDDQVVTPPDSARLDGALNVELQDLCPSAQVAHGELPGNSAVAALLDVSLGVAAPSVPATCPV